MKRFLFPHWEGGGNTPPMLSVVRRLVARGHQVRILADPCNQEEAEAAGASFSSWTRGYRRLDKSWESDPLKDWEVSSPLAVIARLRDRLFFGPSLAYAGDVRDELRRFPADVIVPSEMLFGAMAAAEAAGVPCVGLAANICLFPLPGVPPFGPGFLPARNMFERLRDSAVRSLTRREFGKGAPVFNATRRALGLAPLQHPLDQLERLTRLLVLTSPAFDFPAAPLPAHVVYAGSESGGEGDQTGSADSPARCALPESGAWPRPADCGRRPQLPGGARLGRSRPRFGG
ncbi:MAG: hypothetical protein EXQ47_07185 [Bryobacterales bacterium]|nr:hypothetical protein [Bryobacterales bacterium]